MLQHNQHGFMSKDQLLFSTSISWDQNLDGISGTEDSPKKDLQGISYQPLRRGNNNNLIS